MAFIRAVAGGGGGGGGLDVICSESKISDKPSQTKYTINFSKTISSGDYLLFRIRFPDNSDNTRYSSRIMKYTGSGNYGVASQYTSSGAPVTLNCTIGNNSLTLNSYSGSFQNIYMAIYDASSLFT